MSAICPCCNRPMEASKAPLDALAAAPIWGQQRTILDALAEAYPRFVQTSFIIDRLYGDDPNGGPICADNIIANRVVHLRRKLAAYGWTIPQYTIGCYRLEPIEGAR